MCIRDSHSATALEAGDWPSPSPPEADALVTDRPGILVGVLTADCAPVLLEDVAAGVVAAAHAGWRGALGGILESTIDRMTALGADPARITAAIGPAIAQASYEVNRAFEGAFIAADPDHARFFAPGRPGHRFFDLQGFCAARLAAAGVRRIVCTGVDTLDEGWFSHRRATRDGVTTGRQLSAIAPG
jgi:YfiH family protein